MDKRRSRRTSGKRSWNLEALEDRRLLTRMAVVPGGAMPAAHVLAAAAAPPRVTSFQRTGIHDQTTALVLTFSQDMKPNLVGNGSNYVLGTQGRTGRFGIYNHFIPIKSAIYNPLTRTVTVTPLHRLSQRATYQLTVNGNFGGLASTAGIMLDGNGNGRAGGNFVVTFRGGGAVATGLS